MFREITQFGSLTRRLGTVLLTAMVMLLIGWPAAHAQDCGPVLELDLETPWRMVSGQRGSVERWGIDVPSAGIFVAEISAGNGAIGQPMVEVESAHCGTRHADGAVLERTMSRLVLVIAEPGRLVLRASMVDRRVPLANYRLFNQFVPLVAEAQATEMGWPEETWRRHQHTRFFDAEDRLVAERLAWDGALPAGKTEMEEIDPNPAGAKRFSQARLVATWLVPGLQGGDQRFAKTEMEEIDPNPAGQTAPQALTTWRSGGEWDQGLIKTEMEEIDPNPAGLRLDDATSVRVWVTLDGGVEAGELVKTEMEEIDPNPAGLMAPPRSLRLDFPLELTIPRASHGLLANALRDHVIAEVERWVAKVPGPPAPATLMATLGACAPAVGDDHHASLGCATGVRMGESRAGSLVSEVGEDVDAFGFTVPTMSRVAIRVVSDAIMSAALYDRSGRRLSPRAVEGTDMRMIEALEPGRYVLRFETREFVPAHYRFSVRTLDT